MYPAKEAKTLLQDKAQDVKSHFYSKITDSYLEYVMAKRDFLLSETGELGTFFGAVY